MKRGRCELDPVAIALTKIEIGPTMRFTGNDLESGTPMVVAVDCSAHDRLPDSGLAYQAHGLILMLTIKTFDI